MNIIIFYAPIENKSEHFLFKIKMAIKQTFEGIIGLVISSIYSMKIFKTFIGNDNLSHMYDMTLTKSYIRELF